MLVERLSADLATGMVRMALLSTSLLESGSSGCARLARQIAEAPLDQDRKALPTPGCSMSEKPQRVQLSRKAGWKMPPNTMKVDRSTKWGNPFPIGKEGPNYMDDKAGGKEYGQAGQDGENSGTGGNYPRGFRFNTHDDALNFARHVYENGDRFFVHSDVNVRKRYVEGHVELVVAIRGIVSRFEIHDLIFSRVPVRIDNRDLAKFAAGEGHPIRQDAGWNKQAMSFEVSDVVEGPEGPITPVFVRLEPHKERLDFRDHILGVPPSLKLRSDVIHGPAERESGVPFGDTTKDIRACEDGVVQGVSEVGDGIAQEMQVSLGHGRKLDLVEILAGIRVCLNRAGAFVLLKKGYETRIQICDVLPCMID